MIVTSTQYAPSSGGDAQFLDAAAKARALLHEVRGCRNVTVLKGESGLFRLSVEWRSRADLDAYDVSNVTKAVTEVLGAFPGGPRSVETLVGAPPKTTLDGKALRKVFGHFPTGVAVVAAPGPLAMVVTSFASVSLDPPLVSFCASRTSSTWPHIADAKSCSVNVLASDHGEMSRLLASRKENRFEGFSWKPSPSGAPILDGVVAWLDCSIVETRIAGDHDLVLLEVLSHGESPELEPLLFHRSGYRQFGS